MRVAGRGHIKGFLVGGIGHGTACFGRARANGTQTEQAAAEDGGDLLTALSRGQGFSGRVWHRSSPGSGHTSGVYLPGDGSMCRDSGSSEESSVILTITSWGETSRGCLNLKSRLNSGIFGQGQKPTA